MSSVVHLVVRDGQAIDACMIDPALAEEWDSDGTTEAVWGPDVELVDVSGLVPQPGIGWSREGDVWTAPRPADHPGDDGPPGDS